MDRIIILVSGSEPEQQEVSIHNIKVRNLITNTIDRKSHDLRVVPQIW
jgi:hypothetical protein